MCDQSGQSVPRLCWKATDTYLRMYDTYVHLNSELLYSSTVVNTHRQCVLLCVTGPHEHSGIDRARKQHIPNSATTGVVCGRARTGLAAGWCIGSAGMQRQQENISTNVPGVRWSFGTETILRGAPKLQATFKPSKPILCNAIHSPQQHACRWFQL